MGTRPDGIDHIRPALDDGFNQRNAAGALFLAIALDDEIFALDMPELAQLCEQGAVIAVRAFLLHQGFGLGRAIDRKLPLCA